MKWIRNRRLTEADWSQVRLLREKCEMPGKTEYQKFREVIRANPGLELKDPVEQLCAMAVSMRRGNLKTSSIATTLRKVISYQRGTWTYRETRQGARLVENLEAEGEEARQAATTVTRKRFHNIVREMENITLKAVIELLGNSPMRYCDIRATTFGRVKVGTDFVEVMLQGGKTTKTRLAREKFRIAKKLLSTSTLELFVRGEEEEGLGRLCSLTTPEFNRELRRRKLGVTTYSFRNMWIEEVIKKFTQGDGITDWSSVQKVTLHRSLKALKSNYGYVFDRME